MIKKLHKSPDPVDLHFIHLVYDNGAYAAKNLSERDADDFLAMQKFWDVNHDAFDDVRLYTQADKDHLDHALSEMEGERDKYREFYEDNHPDPDAAPSDIGMKVEDAPINETAYYWLSSLNSWVRIVRRYCSLKIVLVMHTSAFGAAELPFGTVVYPLAIELEGEKKKERLANYPPLGEDGKPKVVLPEALKNLMPLSESVSVRIHTKGPGLELNVRPTPAEDCTVGDLKVGEKFEMNDQEWVKQENATDMHSGQVLHVATREKVRGGTILDPRWPCTRIVEGG